MKYILLFLVTSIFFISYSQTFKSDSVVNIDNKVFVLYNAVIIPDSIGIIFNHTLDLDSLSMIKTKLTKMGIDLQYKKLEFDEMGKLIYIDFCVKCDNEYHSCASIGNLKNDSVFGFYRNKRNNCTTPFKVGKL